ncbi:MAG: response regulator [Cyanophyceae cyanobacterium]
MSSHKNQHNQGNILIVDDIPANVELLAALLKQEGYQVQSVSNSELVVEKASRFQSDLILLDIMMPKINGYEVCRRLKATPTTQDIPIIFLSGVDRVADKVKAFSTGGVDYITKPFQLQEVLARVKNHMTLRFLQKNLQSRNEELAQTLVQLQETQAQLIQSEKMAALGQLVAGIAHEVNSPLGAIRSSAENIAEFLKKLSHLTTFLQLVSSEEIQLFNTLIQLPDRELSSKERRVLKKELLKSIHGLKIDDINVFADLLVDLGADKNLELFLPLLKNSHGREILNAVYEVICLHKSTQTIFTATEQAEKVVLALKNYSRQDHTGQKTVANVIQGIETVLTLYRHQLRQNIEVNKNYADIPAIVCYPDELNQVWTNLIQNAIQAMNNNGTLTIDVACSDNKIAVEISDTGPGIAPEVKPQIFTPFFTTKPLGQGTGLGLDIVKRIVEKHQGKIVVESQPGKTTFAVLLPIHTEEETFYATTAQNKPRAS